MPLKHYFEKILICVASIWNVGHPMPRLQEDNNETAKSTTNTTAKVFNGFFFMLIGFYLSRDLECKYNCFPYIY
jgi:NhaP-type Na+/H+ or K+/H+ antiporter